MLGSPIGAVRLFADGEHLVGLYLPGQPGPAEPAVRERCAVLDRAADQLAEYFAGTRSAFDLALAPRGTEFQRSVWHALCAIPAGETRSYGELAHSLGRPLASRAVGAANGANPISIIVPCHRLIGSTGALTGYAGGLGTKRWLLAHERSHADRRT